MDVISNHTDATHRLRSDTHLAPFGRFSSGCRVNKAGKLHSSHASGFGPKNKP
jgi:hypothetical protein